MTNVFGRENEKEYVLRGTMWADTCWLFCDNKERWVCAVNDIMEELMDLDMAPQPQSLWVDEHMQGRRYEGRGERNEGGRNVIGESF